MFSGTEELWPTLCAVSIIPAIIMSMILPFCPESPRYLLLKKSDTVGATKGKQTVKYSKSSSHFA